MRRDLLKTVGACMVLTLGTTLLILLLVSDPLAQRSVITYAAAVYLAIGLIVNRGWGASDEDHTKNVENTGSPKARWILLTSGLLLFAVEYLLAKDVFHL